MFAKNSDNINLVFREINEFILLINNTQKCLYIIKEHETHIDIYKICYVNKRGKAELIKEQLLANHNWEIVSRKDLEDKKDIADKIVAMCLEIVSISNKNLNKLNNQIENIFY
ncbi:hypothetical protein C0583_06045 [Candidatus Parcubacteria bacterium]|nr:MAG: hypothetical protein C0583_06045 [Candidatus Parcubacteria bacterium]